MTACKCSQKKMRNNEEGNDYREQIQIIFYFSSRKYTKHESHPLNCIPSKIIVKKLVSYDNMQYFQKLNMK